MRLAVLVALAVPAGKLASYLLSTSEAWCMAPATCRQDFPVAPSRKVPSLRFLEATWDRQPAQGSPSRFRGQRDPDLCRPQSDQCHHAIQYAAGNGILESPE